MKGGNEKNKCLKHSTLNAGCSGEGVSYSFIQEASLNVSLRSTVVLEQDQQRILKCYVMF